MKGVFARTNPQLVFLFELLQAHRTDLKGREEVNICYYSPFSCISAFSRWTRSKINKTSTLTFVKTEGEWYDLVNTYTKYSMDYNLTNLDDFEDFKNWSYLSIMSVRWGFRAPWSFFHRKTNKFREKLGCIFLYIFSLLDAAKLFKFQSLFVHPVVCVCGGQS